MYFDDARCTINLHKDAYTWRDMASKEVVEDGLTVLYYVLQVLRPNVNIDMFKVLTKTKQIKPANFAYDMPQFTSKLKLKQVDINTKFPGAYLDQSFINDLFDALFKTPCVKFKNEIQSMKNQFLIDNATGETSDTIVSKKLETLHKYERRQYLGRILINKESLTQRSTLWPLNALCTLLQLYLQRNGQTCHWL